MVNKEETKQLAFGKQRDQVRRLPDVKAPKEAKYLGININQKRIWIKKFMP